MENLAPPLEMLLSVRWSLEKGDSVRVAVLSYIEEISDSRWKEDVLLWWSLCQVRGDTRPFHQHQQSLYRRTVLQTLEQGLAGASIYQQICQLEEETCQACEDEIEKYSALLSIRALIPLLFFQFPAFFILLLGPLLATVLEAAA
jgi:hypothetical protein